MNKFRTLSQPSFLPPTVAGGGASTIPFDNTADVLVNAAIVMTDPAPNSYNGVSLYPGKRALMTKQPAALPIPANVNNGIWVVGPDGNWARPADFATGLFLTSPEAGRGYIVFVADSDASPDAAFDQTYWESNQFSGFTVDVSGTTWFQVTVTAGTIPAGTVEGGPTNPKSSDRPPAAVRLTQDHMPMTKRGIGGSTRRPIHWPIRRANLLSDYVRPDLSMDMRNAWQFAMSVQPTMDELVIDTYLNRFSGVLVIPASWSNKRIIFDPGRGRGDHVKIWTESPGGGIFKIAAKGLTFEGNCSLFNPVPQLSTSVNASAIWLDVGAQDIVFKDGLQIDGFARGVYCPTGVNGFEVEDFSAQNVSYYVGQFFGASPSAPVQYVTFHRAFLNLATSVQIGANPPIGFSAGANVGLPLARGLRVENLLQVGGYRAFEMVDANGGNENTDVTDRPRNCALVDSTISGPTGAGVALDFGSDFVGERLTIDQAGTNGIAVTRKFEGRLVVRDSIISRSQLHGIFDDAVYADRRDYAGNNCYLNGQAGAATYDGFHATPGCGNITVENLTSGHDPSARSAWGTMTLGALGLVDGNTLTIGGTVLTWRTAPAGALDVLIGGTKPASLLNLYAVIQTNIADVNLAKCRYASDEVSKLSIWWLTPGDAAGNAFTLARVGSAMTLSGATLSGAAGTAGQQRYGLANVQDGVQGCRVSAFDGRGNATGAQAQVGV